MSKDKDNKTIDFILPDSNSEEAQLLKRLSKLGDKLDVEMDEKTRSNIVKDIEQFADELPGDDGELTAAAFRYLYHSYNFFKMGQLPVITLRGMVFFPQSVVHFEVSRDDSIAAVETAMKRGQVIFAVSQKNPLEQHPGADDLYNVGTIVKILQIIRAPGEREIKVIAEGVDRGIAVKYTEDKLHFSAAIVRANYIDNNESEEHKAYMNLVKEGFRTYVRLSPKYPSDIYDKIRFSHSASKVADFVASHMPIDYDEKQDILARFDVAERLDIVLRMLNREIDILTIETRIADRAHEHMEEHQKEYFLHEQIRAIRQELGEEDDEEEIELLREQIYALNLEEKSEEQLLKECRRLERLPDSSQEAFVLRSYLELCIELPWNKSSREKIDIPAVAKALDKRHYGLDKVKERILEYLAVRKLTPDVKGQILCLVGPPGVGKTSIAQSIASAIHRKAERVALGGVHDEAEIRGHRRTYIGSMPGRIISAINNAGTNNPLIILDEIDKLASDYKGDPTSALLEVLDPEQNSTFRDHYIDLPFDLSKVMFITTANDPSMIPAPLKDRMEIIEIGSYNREEKFNIAKKHLIPKQLKNNGLKASQCKFSQSAIYAVIDGYTREAGVRTLEKKFAAVMRKAAKSIASGDADAVFKIDAKNIEEYLGPVKFKGDSLSSKNEVGLVNGLAWTAVGGETLPIEVAVVPGTGKIELTGSLGDVMKESAKIAVTCVRTRAEKLGIDPEFYKKNDIHLHAPEGAVPKDGPSAGITMTTAIVSALTGKPVNRFVAMTGEITLRGKVLPIGGLKEKAMGAYKMGIKTIVIPKENESDIYEIDKTVTDSVNIIPVEYIDEVLEIAFTLDKTYEKPVEAKSVSAKKRAKKSDTVSDTQPADSAVV